MTPLSLFYIQMAVDALLCGLIVYFLWRVGKTTTVHGSASESERQELRQLINESQQASQLFLAALAEGRKALHEIAHALDEKESRLQSLCLRAETLVTRTGSKKAEGEDAPFIEREEVLRMANDGASIEDIVRATGLTAGEVHLIIDLARSRDKGR